MSQLTYFEAMNETEQQRTVLFPHAKKIMVKQWLQISAICQEAGMQAVRKNRYVILPKDFEKGYRSNVKKSDTDFEFYR
jgi:ATP-dependent 26S proteasome regulatory subunit